MLKFGRGALIYSKYDYGFCLTQLPSFLFIPHQLGYLQYRGSVVINVSYFFQFHDDPTTDLDDDDKTNVQRAAAMLFATGEFRKSVCSGTLPVDKIGKKQTPLCSTPYKHMFNACRIPQLDQDSYRIYDPSRYTHAIVARNGHFFSVEIVNPKTGDPLSVETLEEQLEQCIGIADSKPPAQLGLLTSSNRDTWTQAREKLIEVGGVQMEKALEIVESGAVLVSLDDTTPVSREECCEKLLTGGKASGSNRWFDKSIQLLVAKNGKAGLMGEHSMMDGMALVNLADHLTNTTYADAKERSKNAEIGPTEVKDIFADVVENMDNAFISPLIQQGKLDAHVLCSAPKYL
jgi:carnitine O-acetyltransferase